MNDSEPPKPKRRWYQFSLWNFLLCLFVGLSILWPVVLFQVLGKCNGSMPPGHYLGFKIVSTVISVAAISCLVRIPNAKWTVPVCIYVCLIGLVQTLPWMFLP